MIHLILKQGEQPVVAFQPVDDSKSMDGSADKATTEELQAREANA